MTTIPTAAEQAAIGALMCRLERAYQFDLRLKVDGLHIINPQSDGCCENNPELSDFVTCKPRADDDNRLWFFHSWGDPITEANRIADAALYIAATLTNRREHAT